LPGDALLDLAEYISEQLEGHVISHEFVRDELVISAKTDSILTVLQFLRDARECEFGVLCDICATDYIGRTERFEVIYSLLSLRQNNRARIKISVEEGQIVPSVTELFSSASWYEREVWDMFGVVFSGNADLRRILTDYGFEGHPLCKDFPLTGYVEVRYNEELKRVAYEPVHLTQDYRNFDFLSPWEGMTNVQLAGDEKGTIPPHGWRCNNDSVCGQDITEEKTEDDLIIEELEKLDESASLENDEDVTNADIINENEEEDGEHHASKG